MSAYVYRARRFPKTPPPKPNNASGGLTSDRGRARTERTSHRHPTAGAGKNNSLRV